MNQGIDPVVILKYMRDTENEENRRVSLDYALALIASVRAAQVGIADPDMIQGIRKRCDAAWPGPWKTTDGYSDQVFAYGEDGTVTRHICDVRGYGHLTGQGSGAMHLTEAEADAYLQADCNFIAQAREDIPYLLSLVESSGALSLEQLKQAIELRRPVYIKGTIVLFQRELKTDQWYFLYETNHHEIAARDSQGIALIVGHMETGLHPGFEAYR